MASPDTIANQSPEHLHASAEGSSNQTIVQIVEKARTFILAFALATCLVSLLFNALFAYMFYVEKYADQNRYDWLQRDQIMPLRAQSDEHDKEIQVLMNQERRK